MEGLRISADVGGACQHARHPAIKIGAAHKKKFEDWLRATFEAAGIANGDDVIAAGTGFGERAVAAEDSRQESPAFQGVNQRRLAQCLLPPPSLGPRPVLAISHWVLARPREHATLRGESPA